MLSKISKLWGLLTGLIVIGIIVYIVLLWITSQSITAEVESIENIHYNPLKNNAEICFKIKVVNNGYIDVEIKKLYYKIYIDNKYLGEGVRENILINRGVNTIDFCLNTKPEKAVKTLLLSKLYKGKVNVTIKGYIEMPIKSFGIIKLWDLEIPYEKTIEVEIIQR